MISSKICWESSSDNDVVLLVESSVFVLLLDGDLVGSSLGSSESVDPSSGSLLLLIDGLLLVLGEDGSLTLDGVLSLLGGSFLGSLGSFSGDRSIGVKPFEGLLVGEWVLLSVLDLGDSDGWSDGSLDFVGVDDSGDVSVGEDGSGELESFLLLSGISVGSEDVVQFSEGSFSPDGESSQLTSWSQLEEVQSVDVEDIDSWDVSEGSFDVVLVVIDDDQGSLLLDESFVSEFSLSGSGLLSVVDSEDVLEQSESLEDGDGISGLGDLSEGVIDDQWQFWEAAQSVSSGQNEGDNTGSSDSGGDGVSLLLDIDSSVPSSPGVEWGEHSTTSAHVSESGLSRSVGTRSRDSWDSGDGSSSSPGLSGVLVSGSWVDSVGLSSVFAQVGVDEVNDIQSDGSLVDSWSWDSSLSDLSVGRVINSNQRSGGHFTLLS